MGDQSVFNRKLGVLAMNMRLGIHFLAAGILMSSGPAQSQSPNSEEVMALRIPAGGFVPDEATAAAIAEAILVPIYGKKSIESQKPFLFYLANDVWTISGQLAPHSLGGVFVLKISKRDGRVLFLSHGR
jgi:hypothetical protein